MIIKILIGGGAAIAALASTAALAEPVNAPGVYAVSAIQAGQLTEAEHILQPASYVDAADPARLINIATVYSRTQRFAEARAALQRVQDLPTEQLDLSDGATYSSHAIAKAMLNRLPDAK